jgi:predicted DNA-binding protein
MLAIRLDKEIEDRLTALAKVTGRTKTYYAREALLLHLDALEARYAAALPRQSLSLGVERGERIVRRGLHAPDGRSASWLERSPAERLAALEEIRLTSSDSSHAQSAFPRFSRITRKAQG